MIETGFITTTIGDSFGSRHHQGATVRTQSAGWLGFNDVFTLWVIGTAVENAKSAAFLAHCALVAKWAFNARVIGLFGSRIFLDISAFRVTIAGNKSAKTTFPLHQLALLTLRARFTGFFGSRQFFTGQC